MSAKNWILRASLNWVYKGTWCMPCNMDWCHVLPNTALLHSLLRSPMSYTYSQKCLHVSWTRRNAMAWLHGYLRGVDGRRDCNGLA